MDIPPEQDPTEKSKVFIMEEQQHFFWCWNAVGTSCARYLDPSSEWTQCKVAMANAKGLKKKYNILGLPDDLEGECCNKEQCLLNYTWFIDKRSDFWPAKGSFHTTNIASEEWYQEGSISLETLSKKLDEGKLVAFRLQFQLVQPIMHESIDPIESFDHFVVISEVDMENEMVSVHDPINGGKAEMKYETFMNNYKNQAAFQESAHEHGSEFSSSSVTHTFFTISKKTPL